MKKIAETRGSINVFADLGYANSAGSIGSDTDQSRSIGSDTNGTYLRENAVRTERSRQRAVEVHAKAQQNR
jgi:hypothetical protein